MFQNGTFPKLQTLIICFLTRMDSTVIFLSENILFSFFFWNHVSLLIYMYFFFRIVLVFDDVLIYFLQTGGIYLWQFPCEVCLEDQERSMLTFQSEWYFILFFNICPFIFLTKLFLHIVHTVGPFLFFLINLFFSFFYSVKKDGILVCWLPLQKFINCLWILILLILEIL